MIQAFLSDEKSDPQGKGIALTEAGIAGGVGSFLGPFLVSLVIFINLGWRAAPTLIVFTLLLACFAFRKTPIPAQKIGAQTDGAVRLPAVYWVLWVVIFLSVAVEWSCDFLERRFPRKNCRRREDPRCRCHQRIFYRCDRLTHHRQPPGAALPSADAASLCPGSGWTRRPRLSVCAIRAVKSLAC